MARARILIADDHKEMREHVVRVLEKEFEVLDAVENGEQVLDMAAKLKPDVCLLDISMPLINGIEAATRLKEAGAGTKVIFLTIHEDVDFVHAALKSGASGYVMKRRIASDLAAAIKEVLAGRIFISAPLNNASTDPSSGPKFSENGK